jgi:hypothetical protein
MTEAGGFYHDRKESWGDSVRDRVCARCAARDDQISRLRVAYEEDERRVQAAIAIAKAGDVAALRESHDAEVPTTKTATVE